VVDLVRAFTVRDHGDTLDLLPLVPTAWLGQPAEVHDLPTAAGRLSFAVRWHGSRPALLWQLERHDDRAPTITASALDPAFCTNEPAGEALLAPPPVSLAEPDGSFG
jgi:hypothetical protein